MNYPSREISLPEAETTVPDPSSCCAYHGPHNRRECPECYPPCAVEGCENCTYACFDCCALHEWEAAVDEMNREEFSLENQANVALWRKRMESER